MARSPGDAFPRGINLIIGGTVVAIGLIVTASLAGIMDVGAAPTVRIDPPAVAETVPPPG